MSAVLLVIHAIIALALIVVVLLQRSEGGALGSLGGGGGGGGGFGGLMSGRQSANLLTRTTTILGATFFGMSLLLALLASDRTAPRSIIDDPFAVPPIEEPGPTAPAPPRAPVAD